MRPARSHRAEKDIAILTAAAHGTRIAGRFLLEALVGAGGMGSVYRALDTETGQKVAIKILQRAGRASEAERFARESELLARLRHPGIVGYLSHGATEAGEPYLVMEWLEGEDLSQRLARGPLSIAESVALARAAAEALAVAHAIGVVHRDIKPSNLFLRGGEVERLALLDFGIARLLASTTHMTRTGALLGTPGYMAPEQARGEPAIAPAADMFSLGCVLFECLGGEPPFAAAQVMTVLAKILFDEPPSPRRARPEVPEALAALVTRMLAKEKGERLADARALLAALDALSGLPLDAPPPSHPSAGRAPRARPSEGEQRLFSVLMAMAPEREAASGPLATTIAEPEILDVQRELSALGARFEVLADGSIVVTLAHELGVATDQAARAARCALSLKARWPGRPLALCTGRGMLHERVPVGEVLERAAELLRTSPASPSPSDQILLDEVTQGLLETRFRVHRTERGAAALSGEELELDASRLLLGKPTPCVGRDVELTLLENALAICGEEREPSAVLITAPPGVGKSRLRHELLRRLEARGEDVLVLVGRGDPMSAGTSYGLLGQALRRLSGIQAGEELELRRTKLARRVGAQLAEPYRARVTTFLGELCGAPFPDEGDVQLRAARQDPQLMSEQITQAMLDFLRAESAARPVLVVLEDLHWGDALTVKLCEVALRKLQGCRLMLLGLARPEVIDLFPRLWSGAAQVVPLRPLSKKASERLAEQALGARAGRETVARIVEQSAGNALFLEELIRSAADGREGEAPETVLAMLQSRIQKLPAGARQALRAASVFGETCWRGGVAALLDSPRAGGDVPALLARLCEDEILEARSESRFPGEQELRFRHALMRDAAYGMLTGEDRVASHLRAGEYLEARGELDALVLAEHFAQGEEPARALPYYLRAAEQSVEANDLDATRASAERALRCGAAGEPRGAILSLLAATSLAQERYTEVIACGVEALDLLPEGSARWCRAAQYLFFAAGLTQQEALLAQLSARFASIDPSDEARGIYVCAASWLAIILGITGHRDASRTFLERARRFIQGLERRDLTALGQHLSAEANDHHDVEEAPWRNMLRNTEALEAYRAAGAQMAALVNMAYLGKAVHELGDEARGEAILRENLALAERQNDALPLTYARTYLARLLARRAPPEQLDEPEQLAREVVAAQNLSLTGVAYGALAEVKRRRGDLAGAEAEARAACEAVRPFPGYAWDLIALLSRILLEQGRGSEALATGEEGIGRLEQLGLSGCGELDLRLVVAEARAAAGDDEGARAMLTSALAGLEKRARDIPEERARERYFTENPTNARLLELARAWLGREAPRVDG